MSKVKCQAKDPSKCRYHGSSEPLTVESYLQGREQQAQAKARESVTEAQVKESFDRLNSELSELRANPSGKRREAYNKAREAHEKLRKSWQEGNSSNEADFSALRGSLSHKLNTVWSLSEEEYASLKEQVAYADRNKDSLTVKDQEELTALSDACENANFHSESIKLSGAVGYTHAVQNPNEPIKQVWSLVYCYDTSLSSSLKDRIRAEHPGLLEQVEASRASRRELGLF